MSFWRILKKSNYLNLSLESISFDKYGNAYYPANAQFTITSNVSWTISIDQSFVSTSSGYGSGNATVTIYCEANPPDNRTAIITISGGGITKAINVGQAVI